MKRGDSDPNEPRAPYICEQCGQSYSRRDTLRNHIKKRHSGIPEGDFFCPGKLSSVLSQMNMFAFCNCDMDKHFQCLIIRFQLIFQNVRGGFSPSESSTIILEQLMTRVQQVNTFYQIINTYTKHFLDFSIIL